MTHQRKHPKTYTLYRRPRAHADGTKWTRVGFGEYSKDGAYDVFKNRIMTSIYHPGKDEFRVLPVGSRVGDDTLDDKEVADESDDLNQP